MTAEREKSMSHEAKASQINELGSTSVWSQHFTSINLCFPTCITPPPRPPPPSSCGVYVITVCAHTTSALRSGLSIKHWSMSLERPLSSSSLPDMATNQGAESSGEVESIPGGV